MSEQMREEFSAWYLAEVTESYGEGVRAQAQKNLDWVREDGSFADPMLRLASLAWQASRESLPSLFTGVDMADSSADGRRSLAEYLIKQIAIEHPDQDTLLTVKYIAQWIALEAGL